MGGGVAARTCRLFSLTYAQMAFTTWGRDMVSTPRNAWSSSLSRLPRAEPRALQRPRGGARAQPAAGEQPSLTRAGAGWGAPAGCPWGTACSTAAGPRRAAQLPLPRYGAGWCSAPPPPPPTHLAGRSCSWSSSSPSPSLSSSPASASAKNFSTCSRHASWGGGGGAPSAWRLMVRSPSRVPVAAATVASARGRQCQPRHGTLAVQPPAGGRRQAVSKKRSSPLHESASFCR